MWSGVDSLDTYLWHVDETRFNIILGFIWRPANHESTVDVNMKHVGYKDVYVKLAKQNVSTRQINTAFCFDPRHGCVDI